jgi:two-component system chemotaxis response regulator CheB
MAKKLRVLIVDDSTFMQKMLKSIINSDPECRVIKTVGDGVEALKIVERLKPDVITMDIELPEIDGLTCIAYIMEEYPTPIVVVTGFSEFMGEVTIKALEYGAVDFMRKPFREGTLNLEETKQELLSIIKLAAQVDVKKLKPIQTKEIRKKEEKLVPMSTNKIVAIACSSGGPRALSQLIPFLPADLPAAVVVVQHIPVEFVFSLASRLNWESPMEVMVAKEGESIHQGKVLLMPPDVHCIVETHEKKGESIRFIPHSQKEKHPFNSMANKLMASLGPVYRKNTTGVILTGMGDDGTEGLRAIKRYGGHTIAEHESTCIVYGMPRSAIQAGVVDKVLPLNKIPDEIIKMVKK